MAKILSIEVGTSVTRIVELDYKAKSPKIYKHVCIPTPQGAQEDGSLQDNGELCLAIKRALVSHQIKTKQVIFVVSSGKIVTREITIPVMKDTLIGNFVRANANDYFPIDLSMYEIAHVVQGREKNEDGREVIRVMAIAAGKDLVGTYAKFAANCGLKFVSVDYIGNSVVQATKAACGAGTVMVAKVEDTSTMVSILSKGNMMLQRNLANGFERALHAMAEFSEYKEIENNELFRMMCEKPRIRVVLNDRTKIRETDTVYGETEEETERRIRVTNTFIQLTGNLQRVVELYNTKAKENPVEKLILVGMGAEIANLDKLFTNELGLPVEVASELTDINGFHGETGENGIGRYVGCIGAAMNPIGIAGDQAKGAKGSRSVNYTSLTVLVILFTLVFAGGLSALSLLPYKQEQERETGLKAKEETFAAAETVNNQYQNVLKLYTYVKSRCQMTESPNGRLVEFLEEMQEKLPADVLVKDFVSDNESISLSMRATSLEEAAKVLQILRGFESVMNVSVDGTSGEQEQEDSQEQQYTDFQVVCTYYPIEIENPDDEESTQN